MSRTIRMFEIIQILRHANQPMTAMQIADILEVSKRTAYRDIATLKAMRVPIDGEAGIGYIMRPGFDLPPLHFTSTEIEAVIVGLSLLKRTGDIGLQHAAEQVVNKIHAAMPEDNNLEVAASQLQVSSWKSAPESSEIISLLRASIRETRCLKIDYENEQGKKTQRFIKPLGIIYYIEVVLLAAWCDLRQDFRHFRIDRISAAKPTKQEFEHQAKALRQKWLEVQNL